ncbi:MAG: SoxR reducing system RseC family protein [Eudoraea sp.]|nr:SoxR reducing system RseC family protein [Eudoraea sp.]MBT8222682.1 SoxR reducing system RseC family protein [Eudoraea sp.]NNK29423.1 SoxR reducing system RseC family protein [Flavobacteriaceae bacterium]
MDFKPKETNAFIHSGVVSEIHGRSIIVSLDKDIHCESCSAKGACGVSDSATKEVEIIDSQETFKLNEPVKVILKKDLGQKAVFWAYIFPFLLMLLTLMTASMLFAEWIAGLLSLLILIPYFATVYALKNYFKRTFRISILRI